MDDCVLKGIKYTLIHCEVENALGQRAYAITSEYKMEDISKGQRLAQGDVTRMGAIADEIVDFLQTAGLPWSGRIIVGPSTDPE